MFIRGSVLELRCSNFEIILKWAFPQSGRAFDVYGETNVGGRMDAKEPTRLKDFFVNRKSKKMLPLQSLTQDLYNKVSTFPWVGTLVFVCGFGFQLKGKWPIMSESLYSFSSKNT